MDTYKVIVYHTSGVNQGNKDFELFCPDLETARQRRKFYVDEAKRQGVKNSALFPSIHHFRESDIERGRYDWYYVEG